jgi:hypothetical protein
MANTNSSDVLASEPEPSGRPIRMRQASSKPAALRSRKRRRRGAVHGGMHQRANKRISW